MKLTDKEAIKALKKVRLYALEEMIDEFPGNEAEGRTDWEMIANEAGWLLDSYDTVRHDDLMEAKGILSKTRYGKIPLYSDYDVRRAKDTVNEYNRLVRFVARLNARGLKCEFF